MSKPPRQAPPRSRPNYGYSIISVALVLFLLGFFGLILLQAQQLMTFFKERVSLIVELNDDRPVSERKALEEVLSAQPYLKAESLTFVSKEEGMRLLQEDFGEDFSTLDLPNPLYDIYSFNVRAEYLQADSLATIRNELIQSPLVSDVYYQQGLVEVLAENLTKIGWITLAIAIIFTFVAFVLIHNTIRLALYSNRFLIKNMELVGASWEFISRPFLWRSVRHGILSGLLAISILNLLLAWAQTDIPELKDLHNWTYLGILFAVLIAFGVLITASSTYYVVNKYLKMRVDDLY